jgi:hypothetical protein
MTAISWNEVLDDTKMFTAVDPIIFAAYARLLGYRIFRWDGKLYRVGGTTERWNSHPLDRKEMDKETSGWNEVLDGSKPLSLMDAAIFAECARVLGYKKFIWNGKLYNTPKDPSQKWDSSPIDN